MSKYKNHTTISGKTLALMGSKIQPPPPYSMHSSKLKAGYSRVQKSIEFFVFRPKMVIFWRAGLKKEGLPLPLAFQYLILMI